MACKISLLKIYFGIEIKQFQSSHAVREHVGWQCCSYKLEV